MKRILFIIFTFVFIRCSSEAQDIHFTQYYSGPANLNPALTGFFNGSQRITMQNKSQWRSVTVPFKTLSAAIDMPVLKRSLKQDMIGGGIVFNRDQAGDSKFGTTQANLSFSYIRALSKLNNQYFSFGVQAGMAQRTIDYTSLVFDSQYDGTSFNPALPNNEQFPESDFIFFDLSAGAYWHLIQHNGLGFNGGLAVYHINKPRQSLLGDNSIKLDRKVVIHCNPQFNPSAKTQVIPGFLLMRQGKYTEFDIGAITKYIKEPGDFNYLALSGGLYYRFGDALNLIAGLDYKEFSAGISYDINLSKLVPASNSKGGFEISLTYILKNSKKVYIKKIPCPIF